jgi:membrane protease YdiL (CAAX protease family)
MLTGRMVSPDESDHVGRTRFHLALAGIFGVCTAPVLSWALALSHIRTPGRWRAWLLGLAVLDTVVAVCLGIIVARGTPPKPVASTGARMGVGLNRDARLVEVTSVVPGGPAERSGLKAGDRVLSVDNVPVLSNDDLAQSISTTRTGTSRHLRIARSGETLEVDVTPEVLPTPPPRPLFEPVDEPPAGGALDVRRTLLYEMVELLLIGGMIGVARRRGHRDLAPPVATLAAFFGAMLVSGVVVEGLRRVLGASLGVALLGWLSSGLVILVTGAAFMTTSRPDPGLTPPLGTLPAVVRGVFYYLAGGSRVAIALGTLAPSLMSGIDSLLGPSGAWPPQGIAFLLVVVVVVAPIGEELLFRGVLLPWTASWSTPTVAVVLTAVVFAAGHLYYGVGAVLIFVVGLVLGWARMSTGRLRASIVLHMLLNGSATAAFLLRRP